MSAIREPLQSSDATVNGAFGLGQRARDNAGMLSFVRTRHLTSMDISRLLDEIRLLDEVHPV